MKAMYSVSTAWQRILVIGFIVTTFLLFIFSYLTGNLYPLQIVFFIYAIHRLRILYYANKGRKKGLHPVIYSDFPSITAVIAAKNEEDVIENSILSIMKSDYQGFFELYVINDQSTDGTQCVVENLLPRFPNLHLINRTERPGKGGALNDVLAITKSSIMAVFDADSYIEPDFFTKSVPYFYRGKNVAGVQSKVSIYNKDQNHLTDLQHEEFSEFVKVAQSGKSYYSGAVGLGGNGQLTIVKAVKEVGGWTEGHLVDDLDLSIRLNINGYNIVYQDVVTVTQEAVSTFKAFIRQRTRWATGNIQCFSMYLPSIWASGMSLNKKIDWTLVLLVSTPFVILFSYGSTLAVLLHAFIIKSSPPFAFIIFNQLIYLGYMLYVFWQSGSRNPFKIIGKFFWRYVYSLHWFIVMTSGLWKSLTKKKIKWDKTVHIGKGG